MKILDVSVFPFYFLRPLFVIGAYSVGLTPLVPRKHHVHANANPCFPGDNPALPLLQYKIPRPPPPHLRL